MKDKIILQITTLIILLLLIKCRLNKKCKDKKCKDKKYKDKKCKDEKCKDIKYICNTVNSLKDNCNKYAITKNIINNVIIENDISSSIFSGYTPLQIRTAYNIPTYTARTNKRCTVTIIIAFTYPKLQEDFNTFCVKFRLPYQKLNIITLGSIQNEGWALEECLDVQMAYLANPNAQITVIEAASNSYTDLNNAIKYANNLPTTQIISMSWGSNEYFGQNSNDIYFSNTKICYCASSGDTNYVSYPASSPNVLAIGGSTLILDNNSNRKTETTWNYAGCGRSLYTRIPSYQSGCKNITGQNRIIPDISCIANPDYGVIIYYKGQYYRVGGTSVSAPLMAGILSIANQMRFDSGKGALTSVATSTNNMIQKYIYKNLYNTSFTNNASSLYKNNFYDITIGTDGIFNATTNYDFATGLGAPKCVSLLNVLINA